MEFLTVQLTRAFFLTSGSALKSYLCLNKDLERDLKDFEMYITANGITDKAKKRALLLYQTGARVREIFRQIPDNGDDKDYDKAVEKLSEYFEPQKHRLYEVYKFREAKTSAKR